MIKFPLVPLKNFRGFLLILKDANTPEVCFLRQVALAILILLSLFLFLHSNCNYIFDFNSISAHLARTGGANPNFLILSILIFWLSEVYFLYFSRHWFSLHAKVQDEKKSQSFGALGIVIFRY